MDTTDGYKIQKSILFETGHGIAMGCAPGLPHSFRVWHFTETGFGRDYYWGSCPADRNVAEEIFHKKADCYRGLYGVEEKTGHSTSVFYRYYSTQRPVDIGTYPKPDGNKPLVIVNYDCDRRRPVVGGKIAAWGELTYREPLTEKQAADYELTPAPGQAMP